MVLHSLSCCFMLFRLSTYHKVSAVASAEKNCKEAGVTLELSERGALRDGLRSEELCVLGGRLPVH